jgi:hypothetical protein
MEDRDWWRDAQDWQRWWRQHDDFFEGLGGGIGLTVIQAALRCFYGASFRAGPPPRPGIPTVEECYRLRDAQLLAERNFGRRKLTRWRNWQAAHPLSARPHPPSVGMLPWWVHEE